MCLFLLDSSEFTRSQYLAWQTVEVNQLGQPKLKACAFKLIDSFLGRSLLLKCNLSRARKSLRMKSFWQWLDNLIEGFLSVTDENTFNAGDKPLDQEPQGKWFLIVARRWEHCLNKLIASNGNWFGKNFPDPKDLVNEVPFFSRSITFSAAGNCKIHESQDWWVVSPASVARQKAFESTGNRLIFRQRMINWLKNLDPQGLRFKE